MPDSRNLTSASTEEEESLEILRDRTHAWWIAVLAGQSEVAHPIHGTNIKTEVSEGVLTISGTVPSEQDRLEIVTEAEALKDKGIDRVDDQLTVVDEGTGEVGLLVQTLIGVFENEEQASFAEGYLEGHAHITPGVMQVLAPDGDEQTLQRLLPAAWVGDAEEILRGGRALLLVTVDETEAFRTRELLDEETRSLRTLVLPPEPARNAGEQQRRGDGGRRATTGGRYTGVAQTRRSAPSQKAEAREP